MSEPLSYMIEGQQNRCLLNIFTPSQYTFAHTKKCKQQTKSQSQVLTTRFDEKSRPQFVQTSEQKHVKLKTLKNNAKTTSEAPLSCEKVTGNENYISVI